MVASTDLRDQPTSDNPFIAGLLGYQSFRQGYEITVVLQADAGDRGSYGGARWAASGAKDAFIQASEAWSAVANVAINVLPVNYQGTGDRSAYTWVERLEYLPDFAGEHAIPQAGDLYGAFNDHPALLNPENNQKGAYNFHTFLHEIGHGLGLMHPFDGPANFPGVDGYGDSGDYSFNNVLTTVMSYSEEVGFFGESDFAYGWVGTPMAFDIAAIQLLYGANMSTRTGDDIYLLPTQNAPGTYWICIWDAGGIDTISAAEAGSRSIIDLRPASLLNAPGGGGWTSRTLGIHGGFTIAHGVTIENAIGSGWDDTITGNEADNLIAGGGGDDEIIGGGGHDHLTGGTGNDRLYGGAGINTMAGGAGDDVYEVETASDQLIELASEGNDIVRAKVDFALPDHIEDLRMSGDAAIGTGNDAGNRIEAGSRAALIHGKGGNDSIGGSDHGDALHGDAGNDTVDGGSGADTIYGGQGDDILSGDLGVDEIYGGDGNDQLYGSIRHLGDIYAGASVPYFPDGKTEDVADILSGGAGNDTIFLDGAFDQAYKAVGPTLIHYRSHAQIDGGAGTDTLSISSYVEFEGTLSSIERFQFNLSGRYWGNPQFPDIDPPATLVLKGEKVALIEAGSRFGGIGTVVVELADSETFDASSWVFDDNAKVSIKVSGGYGGNHIVGTSQSDLISGADGADTFAGGSGDDVIDGGGGIDVVQFSGPRSAYTIAGVDGGKVTVSSAAEGFDILTGIETFVFSDGTYHWSSETEQLGRPPQAPSQQQVGTLEDTPVSIDVGASDPDGDVLSFSYKPGSLPAKGSVSFSGNAIVYTPDTDATGSDSFAILISDGTGATAEQVVSVSIEPVNDAPALVAEQSVRATYETAMNITIAATDVDGDSLSFAADGVEHGTLSGGASGIFTYTPKAGFIGEDSFTVTVSDGNGGVTQGLVEVAVGPPLAKDYRMLAADGFVGAISGGGQVIGTAGTQDITVLDLAGTVSFDPSFNRGGDVVRLSGSADIWQVGKSGSSAVFTDGDTFVQLSVGAAGMAVVFDDGARTLRIDPGDGSFRIGDQAFTATLAPIDAAPDGTILPANGGDDGTARLFVAEGGSVSAAGSLMVIGTAGAETVTILSGDARFDPSFNKGGDVIALNETADAFLASRSGSSVFLEGTDTTLLIAAGPVGATLAFGDGSDTRQLLLSMSSSGIAIGDQLVTGDPVLLAAA